MVHKDPRPPVGQYTPARHRFLAEVRAGFYALRFAYGNDRNHLVWTDRGRTAGKRGYPRRDATICHNWGKRFSFFSRNAGFAVKDQELGLYDTAGAILDTWNAVHGDPLAGGA